MSSGGAVDYYMNYDWLGERTEYSKLNSRKLGEEGATERHVLVQLE